MERTWSLQAEGWLPGWAGVILFVALAAFLLFHLRREFKDTKRGVVTRLILPGIRLAVGGLVVWLLCQPVLTRVDRTKELPRFLLVTVDGKSMRTEETFSDLGRKIDLLENLTGKALKSRKRSGSRLARAVRGVVTLLEEERDSLRMDLSDLATGMPPNPDVPDRVRSFAAKLDVSAQATQGESNVSPPKDEALLKKYQALRTGHRDLMGRAGGLVEEGELVAGEAQKHPEMLSTFLDRVVALLTAARELQHAASEFQTAQDQQNIIGNERAWAEKRLTRRALGKLAETYIERQLGTAVRLDKHSVMHLEGALTEARQLQGRSPLDGILIMSDGAGLNDLKKAAPGKPFAAGDLPVHTLLTGYEGIVPQDAGLVAVDLPPLLLCHQEGVARVLVKNELPVGTECHLEVRSGADVIATHKLPANPRGQLVIEVGLVFKEAGRHQLQFQLRSPEPDAYPGNERRIRTVDVFQEKAQVLLMSDRITDDFTAYKSALESMPTVKLQSLLSAPGLSRIKIGKEADSFPGQLQDWEGIRLVVLLGGIPEDMIEKGKPAKASSVLVAFNKAISEGLCVLVHQAADVDPANSWASCLDLTLETEPVSGLMTPAEGLWLDLHQLALDEVSSRHAWTALGQYDTRILDMSVAVPLLTVQGRPALSLIRRGSGRIIHNGLPPLTRQAQKSPDSVNRLLHGILALALRPLSPTGETEAPVIFPPQPILGKDIVIWPMDLDLQSGSVALRLESVPQASEGAARFSLAAANDNSPTQAIVLVTVNGELLVEAPVDLASFHLTPNSQVLRRLASTTGGTYADLDTVEDLVSAMKTATGQTLERAWVFRLWRGGWSLALLLLLVSAEYLLRRRVGRVM